MKNLFTLLVFSLMTIISISCQSDTNKTASDSNSSKAMASTPNAVPTAAPAPVNPAPNAVTAETDEAPAVPAEPAMATKSGKNMEEKASSMSDKTKMTDKMKETMTEKKGTMMDKKKDVDAQIAAEKEKLAAASAKATAERKAAEAKEMAAKKAAEAKKMTDEKAAEAREMANKKAAAATGGGAAAVTGAGAAAAATGAAAATTNAVKDKMEKAKEDVAFSHQMFDELLKKHVSSAGKVNYGGIKQDKAKLTAYLKQLENQPIESSWSKNKKLAFYINAYNANTISLIVDNYPVSSIKDLEGGKPWDKKFVKLDGKTLTLNNIENDIIRPTFKENRIHFAVNCAAKSCPPLLNKAWTEDNIQSELDKRAKAFINNPDYNMVSASSAKISKIFEWYAADFPNLNDFLAKYSSVNSSTKISYIDYNWALNN